jgi:hypothetical protein
MWHQFVVAQQGGLAMTISSTTRFKSDNAADLIKAAKQAKIICEKHGAKSVRMGRLHTGQGVGEYLFVTYYSDWEALGKTQAGLDSDPAWAQLLAYTATIAELTDRNIDVNIAL